MSDRVVVRRSVWRVLLAALAGVPLLFLVADYLWDTFGFLDRLGAWAYRANDPDPFELRDDILAALIGLIGLGFVGFGLKELVVPRRVLDADAVGLRLPLSGPFGKPTTIPWASVRDLESEPHRLVVHVTTPEGIPDDPWGARWRGTTALVVPTRWWGRSPDWAIDRIAEGRLPDEARARHEERLLEEARIHAAAMEIISGSATVADPTLDPAPAPPAEPPPHDMADPVTHDEPVEPAAVDEPAPSADVPPGKHRTDARDVEDEPD